LWGEGNSSGLIGKRLGITRNAVIGKAHRLGLPGRNTTSRIMPRRARKPRGFNKPPGCNAHYKTAPHQPEKRCAVADRAMREQLALEHAAAQAQSDLFIPPEERRSILLRNARGGVVANDTLDERACRWVFGDGSKSDPFYCCGKAKVPGPPYCEFHARRAYNPTQPEVRFRPSRHAVRHVADIRNFEVLEPA
jgi:GcrA cell cycle regulator